MNSKNILLSSSSSTVAPAILSPLLDFPILFYDDFDCASLSSVSIYLSMPKEIMTTKSPAVTNRITKHD